jgi:hypothetical protein
MTFLIGTPHASGSGYFLNDDRNSGGAKAEAHVQCCGHCQKVIKLELWKEDGGFCRRCMLPVCASCADRMLTYGCEPFIKLIEREAERAVRLSQFRKLAGLE